MAAGAFMTLDADDEGVLNSGRRRRGEIRTRIVWQTNGPLLPLLSDPQGQKGGGDRSRQRAEAVQTKPDDSIPTTATHCLLPTCSHSPLLLHLWHESKRKEEKRQKYISVLPPFTFPYLLLLLS